MLLSCNPPSQPGPNPPTCRTRLSHAMEESPSAKSSHRKNAASFHTINVVLPDRSHPSHSATSEKGNEPVSTDKSRNRSSPKLDDAHLNAEISVVPDPVPNPLVQVPYSSVATPRLDSPRTTSSNASPSIFAYSSTSVVPSALLPLSSTAATHSSTSSFSFVPPTSVSAEHPIRTFNNVPSRQNTPHQLPAAAIILLAAGSVLFVATILILIKLYIRPRRRSHPTPSLPILQDAFPPRKLGDESPLFGGKERLSSQPAMSIPWTWTQYQSDGQKSAPAASISKSRPTNQPPIRHSRLVDDSRDVLDIVEPTMPEAEAVGKPVTTNQSSDGHINKALSRLSSLSGLVYPASVYDCAGQENIGIAVSSGQGDLEFGGSAVRDYRRRSSARQSMRNFDKRRSTIYGSPEGLAYTMSPSMPPGGNDILDSDGFSRQGRARVKAPYVARSYLHGSVPKGPDTRRHPEVNPFGDPVDGVYALPPMPDSSSGKEANLKGVPLVVGPIIPDPPVSPGLSSYPDESLSVAEDRSWAVPNLVKIKEYTYDSTGMGGNVQDGVAMGDDRPGASESPGVAARRLSMLKTRTREQPPEKLRRTDDKPPRVPSPPVLPSLAQMAMAHTNGQEYGDYRSPTYSLYGLYSG
jgi:hypothetical protein